ncbi:uncharacterized protein G2W53_010868 [Senna tora]|uniref:Uncharacterized protein n=1 Tax=Senna tora TaxID=362788 RepID=A0A835CA98_9FABA|nr:uncharacterized protein G2W53_010868 [Senna tora]
MKFMAFELHLTPFNLSLGGFDEAGPLLINDSNVIEEWLRFTQTMMKKGRRRRSRKKLVSNHHNTDNYVVCLLFIGGSGYGHV